MKLLLVAEYRAGLLHNGINELLGFARNRGGESSLFMVGHEKDIPACGAKRVYFGDIKKYGEYDPPAHTALLIEAVEKEQPDLIVFSHTSYGWDLAPRLAYRLGASQISEVTAIGAAGDYYTPLCNGKLQRRLQPQTPKTVLTLQPGAFTAIEPAGAVPEIIPCETELDSTVVFTGYEAAEEGGVDLSKSNIIVSGGRGIGKPENMELIRSLARALKGEYGASRPVVDAQWADHNRQVGTTGQSVAPKLYVACGISGAIQHLAGMKKSEFIVAVNTDRDAPIGEVADVLVVADLKQFIPVLTEKIAAV